MDYDQTIKYLYSQLPLFTRDGASAYKEDLTNTIELCKRLGDPQHKFRSVHVAGTNGKGSTSHMLAAILHVAGYKTGLYTSPHLKDFRERIRINGEMMSEEDVIDFVEKHKPDFEDIRPSFFEMTVGLAFEYFAEQQVDIAIIEVGLGGRLDSTNIITPLLSVITNIGWDHMNILGDTLQKIAAEKAGIIKPNIPSVIGEYQPEIAQVFIDKANKEHSRFTFASEVWKAEIRDQQGEDLDDNFLNVDVTPIDQNIFLEQPTTYNPQPATHNPQPATHNSQLTTHNPQPTTHISQPTTRNSQLTTHNLQLDLTGTYQLKNVKTVLCAVEELRSQGFVISDDAIREALSQVKILTGLHGRWETLNSQPLTICDTGHNPEGIAEVLVNILRVKFDRLHFVVGVVNDKDSSRILAMLPKDATYYFCKPDIPRGLDAESLKLQAESFGLHGAAYTTVTHALGMARQSAGDNDLVFVGGSTFVVAEVV